ncbi:MAG: hypothetical protein IPM82_05270 [Saprospiraceae bacterium]|nr:hypothetical protein [Saprospiraceae bacterium]
MMLTIMFQEKCTKGLTIGFFQNIRTKLHFYENILAVTDATVKEFFLVSLSHILKNCSKWLQSSTKPQIDPNKKPADPFSAFNTHTRMMIKRNGEFFNQLSKDKYLATACEIRLEDARKTSIKSNSVGAIITSPPLRYFIRICRHTSTNSILV